MFKVFGLSLTLFSFARCWLPTSCSWTYKIYYRCGTFIYFVSVIFFIISQIANIIFAKNNWSNLIASCPMLIATINGLIKSIGIVRNQFEIIELFNMFMSDLAKPRDNVEINIKFITDKYCRLIEYFCMSLAVFIASGYLLNGLIRREGPFPKEALSIDDTSIFNIISFLLLYGTIGIYMGLVLVASNILFAGLMLQLSAQFEILSHRLESLKLDKTIFLYQETSFHSQWKIQECIHHHQLIIRIAKQMKKIFQMITRAQMIITLGNFATGVFQLLYADIGSVEFFTIVIFLLHSLEEGWLYFWFTDEVMKKSTEICDAAYAVDWQDLSKSLKLDIMFIMTRANRPIVFQSLFRIPLSAETFARVLSKAYQAFALFREVTK